LGGNLHKLSFILVGLVSLAIGIIDASEVKTLDLLIVFAENLKQIDKL